LHAQHNSPKAVQDEAQALYSQTDHRTCRLGFYLDSNSGALREFAVVGSPGWQASLMYLSYTPWCHWLLSKVIKHLFQRAATTKHKLVITAFSEIKIELELVGADAAIHAHAESIASKHIGNMHSCTVLVMEHIAQG